MSNTAARVGATAVGAKGQVHRQRTHTLLTGGELQVESLRANWTDLPSDFSNFPNGDCYKSLCHFLT